MADGGFNFDYDYGHLTFLSPWQKSSVAAVCAGINAKVWGLEKGPRYIAMPTGSGKTVGAVEAIRQHYADKRICFLTPYIDAVETVYNDVVASIGSDMVGVYWSGCPLMNKDEALFRQVVILTHQFVAHNPDRLQDRDLIIVDEAIYSTNDESLGLSAFASAMAWAQRTGECVVEFEAAFAFANKMHNQRGLTSFQYIAPSHDEDLSWASSLAKIEFWHCLQFISANDHVLDVQRFASALANGMGFLSRGSLGGNRSNVKFCASQLSFPDLDKVVVLTASGWLLYEETKLFKPSFAATQCWSKPSFANLSLTQLPDPNIGGHYSSWGQAHKVSQVEGYLDNLLRIIPETEIYLTCPLAILKNCLRQYLDLPLENNGDLLLPATLSKLGKTIHISHHDISVGSNKFKSSQAVVYLWENFKPSFVAVERHHTLTGRPVTQSSLASANGQQLGEPYRSIKDVLLIENIVQHIGRGNIRNYDKNGICGTMKAYILCSEPRFEKLKAIYPDCTWQNAVHSNTHNREARVIRFLMTLEPKRHVSAAEVQAATGAEVRKIVTLLEGSRFLHQAGYRYVKGGRGRGKSSYFEPV